MTLAGFGDSSGRCPPQAMPKTYGRAGYGAITPSTLTATRRSLLTVRVGLCTDSIGGSPMGHSPKTHFLCCTTMTGPPVAHLLTSARGPRKIIRQTRWSGAAGRGRAGTSDFANGGNSGKNWTTS